MKIVINGCYGGFSLSDAAMLRYGEIKRITLYPETTAGPFFTTVFYTVPKEQRVKPLVGGWNDQSLEDRIAYNQRYIDSVFDDLDIPRDCLALVRTVEELGENSNGRHAHLQGVEIPDGVDWIIQERDGREWIAEKHRTWTCQYD